MVKKQYKFLVIRMPQNIHGLVKQFGSATKLTASTEHRETQQNKNFFMFTGTNF